MFGMGFMEIMLVAVMAVIALGPEKLPTAMVDIARFFKKFKSGIDDAKSTLDNELKISELKGEANKFKEQLSVVNPDNLHLSMDKILDTKDDKTKESKKKSPKKVKKETSVKSEKVSFKKDKETVQDKDA